VNKTEMKNMYFWFVVAMLLLIPGLWMFYVAPTIWFIDVPDRAGWFTLAILLTGFGTFIILYISNLIAKGSYERKE